jgi:hypothetical protein
MNIPPPINQVPDAETPAVLIVHPIAAGRGIDHEGTLVLLCRLASFRELDRRGGIDG